MQLPNPTLCTYIEVNRELGHTPYHAYVRALPPGLLQIIAAASYILQTGLPMRGVREEGNLLL